MSISMWPESDRPREKLLLHGASALSDAELLAIFLRTGVPGLSAVDLARQLLVTFGSPARLFYATHQQFTQIKGLGNAKYAQLMAVRELAQRALSEEMQQGKILDSIDKAADFLRLMIARPDREVFYVIFLSAQHQVIAHQQLFEGSLKEAVIYPRELIKITLDHHAAALILAHNHPSGNPQPSAQDIELTHYIKTALEFIEVRLLDHLIVTSHQVVSMAQLGLMPAQPSGS
jgi:DNA repair protein RadC